VRFELFVAFRYLRAKRRQAVISLITGISVLGVAAGVASLIIALAITNGFRQDLEQRLVGASAHVSLLRVANDGIRDWPALVARLEKQPHVVAAAPALYEQVLVSRGARARGVVIKGVLPDSERRVGGLLQTVKFGSAGPLSDVSGPCPEIEIQTKIPAGSRGVVGDRPGGIPPGCLGGLKVPEGYPAYPPLVLGKGAADELGATVGTVVLVTSPQGELTPFGMVPKYVRFKVVGIFESGFYDYDTAWGFTRLADAQRLFGLGDVVSVVEFKVDDLDRAGEIGQELERAAGPGFMSTNWMEQNRALFRALRLERRVTFITVGLIVLVAALNILISLIMMVMEKTRDIAVLLSLGARRAQVRNIFLLEGVLIGVVGTVLGLALGYALAWAGGHYRWISLSPEIYSIDYVPFAPRLLDGLLVALMSLGISFVATLYPSWSAARILPAEALRYE